MQNSEGPITFQCTTLSCKFLQLLSLTWLTVCRFRAAPETDRHADSISPKKAKSDRRRHTSSSKSHRSGSSEPNDSSHPDGLSPLTAFLTPALPLSVTIKDPSLEVLALLRLLNGLNRHWSTLFDVSNVV